MKSMFALFCSITILLTSAQSMASENLGSLVSLNHTSDDMERSLRFETIGDNTEIRQCQKPLKGAAAQILECDEPLGVYSTEELAEILEAGWIESLLADAQQLGSAATGGAITAAVVYVALNKVSKGLLSKPTSEILFKDIVKSTGLITLIGANSLAGVTGAFLGNEAFNRTATGREAKLIDRRNAIAADIRDGEVIFTTEDEFIIPELLTYLSGQLALLDKKN